MISDIEGTPMVCDPGSRALGLAQSLFSCPQAQTWALSTGLSFLCRFNSEAVNFKRSNRLKIMTDHWLSFVLTMAAQEPLPPQGQVLKPLSSFLNPSLISPPPPFSLHTFPCKSSSSWPPSSRLSLSLLFLSPTLSHPQPDSSPSILFR